MQGCKRDAKTAQNDVTNNVPTDVNTNLSLPPIGTSQALYSTNPTPLNESSNSALPPGLTNGSELAGQNTSSNQDMWNSSATNAVSAEAGVTKEYTVVRNDNYYKIAKANGTTVSALKKANPTVDPAKIHPGMKLQVPVRSATQAASGSSSLVSGTAAPASSGSGEGKVYSVKPGDTLTRIAHSHGVTVTAIRNANGMKTSRVNVGQKLKIPASTKTSTAVVKEAKTNAVLY